ncbi:MAG: hypothetical protein WC843_01080 [Candidatus Gracilibacteria bacterium]|jgi:hypothetical protein
MGGDANKPKGKIENAERAKDQREITPSDASKQERASVAIDVTKGKSEKEIAARLEEHKEKGSETLSTIKSINVSKETKEQLEAIKLLKVISYVVFTKLFNKGLKFKDVKELSSLTNVSTNLTTELDSNEKTAFEKLKEIAENSNSILFKEFTQTTENTFNWSSFIEDAHAQFQAVAFKPSMHAPETVPLKPTEESKSPEKAFHERAFDWIKENPGKTALITAGVFIAGYGLYEYFSSDENKDEKKEGSNMNKYLLGGGLALSGLVLGGILGKDKVLDWFKEHEWISDEKKEKFLAYWNAGERLKAIETLFESPDPNWEKEKQIAEKISKETGKKVSALTLSSIANLKYDDFRGMSDEVKKLASSLLKTGGLSFLSKLVEESPIVVQEAKVIKDYLAKKQDKIKALNLPENVTVLEVLGKLTEIHVEVIPQPEEEKSVIGKAGKAAGIVFVEGKEKVSGFFQESYDAIKKEFDDIPEIQEILKKYDNGEATLHPYNFITELFNACTKNKVDIVLGMGKVALYRGGKFIFISSYETLYNTAVAFVKSPGISAPVQEYLIGATPFIAVGSAIGGIINSVQGHSFVAGAFRGAAKGAIFPVTIATETGKFITRGPQRIYRTAKGMEYSVKETFSSEAGKLAIIEEEARFYAKIANGYDDLIVNKDGLSIINPKRWYAKLSKARLEELRFEYMKKFAIAYNKLNKGPALSIEKLNDTAEIKDARQKIYDLLKDAEAKDKLKSTAAKTTPVLPPEEPKHLGSEGPSGPDQKHKYKYFNEEVELQQKNIEAKAGEIAKTETPPTDPAELQKWNDTNWNKAIKALCEEKLLTPTPVQGKKDVYRFQNKEITIPKSEIEAKMKTSGISEIEATKALCYEKALAHVTVQEVKIVNGEYQYKINGEWVTPDDPKNPVKAAEIKEKWMNEMQKKGVNFDFQKFAGEAKYFKYFSAFEKVLGTAAAVGIFYHLYSAPDKKKAVAETTAGLATFITGAKLTEWKIGKHFKNPIAKGVIDMMGGVAFAMGFTEPISKLVDDFIDVLPAGYGVSKEVAEIMEKAAAGSIVRTATLSLEKGILRSAVEKGATKLGFKGIERVFEKKIESTFLKKIMTFSAEKGFGKILKMLGWRGATTIALLADDATVIGVLDDVIALGFIVWMGIDIVEIVMLMRNAYKVKEQMAQRTGKEITEFKPEHGKSEALIQKELAKYGKTISQIHELSEDDLFAILKSIDEPVTFKIKRAGVAGYESWTLTKGEASGIAIFDDAGGKIAEIEDKDAAKIDKAVKEMEEKAQKEGKTGKVDAPSEGQTPAAKAA